VDGREGKKYDGIGESSPIFSPDGKRVAYWGKHGNKQLIVVDGVESQTYDGFLRGSKLVFDSPTLLHGLAARDNEILRIDVEIVEDGGRR